MEKPTISRSLPDHIAPVIRDTAPDIVRAWFQCAEEQKGADIVYLRCCGENVEWALLTFDAFEEYLDDLCLDDPASSRMAADLLTAARNGVSKDKWPNGVVHMLPVFFASLYCTGLTYVGCAIFSQAQSPLAVTKGSRDAN